MAITYDAPSNTITVTEGTAEAPNTLQDIKDADDGGGWGVTTKQGDSQYKIDALLFIGDGSTTTYFASERECLEQNEEFRLFAAAEARFGDLVDGHSINGSYIKFNKLLTTHGLYLYYGTLKIYGCIFDGRMNEGVEWIWIRMMAGSTADFRESNFNHIKGIRWFNTDSYVENCLLRDSSWGYYISAVPDNVWTGVVTDYMAQFRADGDITMWNVDSPNVAVISPEGWHNTFTFVNLVQDPDVTISAAAEDDVCIHMDHSFDLKVVDDDENNISGATVIIKDKDGDTVVDTTTGEDGTITQETFTRKKYCGAASTETVFTPHSIKISKAGYETYYKIWTIASATAWVICLKNSLHVNLLEDDPIVKLHPESYIDKERRKFMEV